MVRKRVKYNEARGLERRRRTYVKRNESYWNETLHNKRQKKRAQIQAEMVAATRSAIENEKPL